jgi:hypothetical protein
MIFLTGVSYAQEATFPHGRRAGVVAATNITATQSERNISVQALSSADGRFIFPVAQWHLPDSRRAPVSGLPEVRRH